MSPATALTPSVDPVTHTSVTPTQIITQWDTITRRFTQSRMRGLACHNLRHNLSVPSVPSTWGTQADRDEIVACLPERQLIEQGIINDLSEYWPVYRRQAIGQPTPTKTRQAGSLERWLEGCGDEQMDRDLIWLKSGEDGEFAYILLPDLADYHRVPSYSDSIDDADYRELAKDAQTGWHYSSESKKWKRPKKQYWRDGHNNPTQANTKRSERKTREAYDHEINTLGKRLPWVERVVSMYDCAPNLVRGRGKNRYEVKSLIVRTLYDVDDLERDGWQWAGQKNKSLIPRGFSRSNNRGANSQVYLYEYYFTDMVETEDPESPGSTYIQPHPCVAYTIAGKGTSMEGAPTDDEVALIDLYDEFGLDELPVGYFYGMRTGADDPDFIGRPLLWPLLATVTNLEKIVTAKNAYDFDGGFPGYVMPLTNDMSETQKAALMDGAEFKPFERPEAGQIEPMPLPVVPFQAAQSTVGVAENIAFHSDRLQRNKPQQEPGERSKSASGHSMMVAEDLEQQAHRQLQECVRQVHEFAGRQRIKFACAFKRMFGVDIPVEANLEHSSTASPADGEARGLLEFDAKWVGEVYKITSEFPKIGNLAEAQQYAQFYLDGLVLWEEFREKLGDTDPANSWVKKRVEDYLKSPAGMLRTDQEVARIMNDQEEVARLQAELDGLIGPDGVPPGAVAPEFADGGASMPGVDVPNIAASVEGSIIGGQMGQASQVADATAMAAVPGGF